MTSKSRFAPSPMYSEVLKMTSPAAEAGQVSMTKKRLRELAGFVLVASLDRFGSFERFDGLFLRARPLHAGHDYADRTSRGRCCEVGDNHANRCEPISPGVSTSKRRR